MNINEEARKDPEQLEREVDERRAHLGDTLNALEQKLSPGHLFDQVLAYTRANGGEFSQNLVNTIKQNPVPTLLTAIGVSWLMYGQNRPGRTSANQYSAGTNSTGSAFSSTAGHSGITDRAREGKQNLANSFDETRHRVTAATDKLREQAHHTSDSLRHQGQRAREGFTHLLEDQPLALGAIGIAIGALLGGSFPRTEKENQLMGEYRDSLADKASDTARQTYDKVGEVGHKVASDVKRDVKHEVESSTQRPSYQ